MSLVQHLFANVAGGRACDADDHARARTHDQNGVVRRFRSLRSPIAAVALITLLVAACGDDDATAQGPDTKGNGSAATVVGDNIAFDNTELTAAAGEPLEITFDNRDDGIPHNIHVRDNGVDEKTEITAGPSTQRLEVTFDQAGAYRFFCDVHPAQMNGTITVE